MTETRFHLAFLVTSLKETRHFYCEVLGCREGRSADRWVDFDLFGHQLSAHLVDKPIDGHRVTAVDGGGVPIPHFGLVLPTESWRSLRDRLIACNTQFVLEPRIRFEGLAGEQATMFLKDPSGNHLEFKSFASDDSIFSTD